jgi:hypothetical protein
MTRRAAVPRYCCVNLTIRRNRAHPAALPASGGSDDGDALALTFAQPVVPAEVEEQDEEEEIIGGYGINGQGAWMR